MKYSLNDSFLCTNEAEQGHVFVLKQAAGKPERLLHHRGCGGLAGTCTTFYYFFKAITSPRPLCRNQPSPRPVHRFDGEKQSAHGASQQQKGTHTHKARTPSKPWICADVYVTNRRSEKVKSLLGFAKTDTCLRAIFEETINFCCLLMLLEVDATDGQDSNRGR